MPPFFSLVSLIWSLVKKLRQQQQQQVKGCSARASHFTITKE
jgi:hypothetical protein